MTDVIVNEQEYAALIAERDEYRAKLAAYEASDLRTLKAQADAALKLSALNSQLLDVLKLHGIAEWDCQTCQGEGVVKRRIDIDIYRGDVCPDCDGERVVRLEDL